MDYKPILTVNTSKKMLLSHTKFVSKYKKELHLYKLNKLKQENIK